MFRKALSLESPIMLKIHTHRKYQFVHELKLSDDKNESVQVLRLNDHLRANPL